MHKKLRKGCLKNLSRQLKEYKKEEEGCYSLGKQKDRLADKLSKKKQKMDSCNIIINKM
jgi:hypothetical protein